MSDEKIVQNSAAPEEDDIILSVRHLTVDFRSDEGYTQAVRDVSFDLKRGETLCIVGESGSGKSVSCKTIMGILSSSAVIRSGSIIYRGEDLTKVSEEEFHRIRGNLIGMIFQDPLSALDPIVRIGKQLTETMLVNRNRLKIYKENLTIKELSAYNTEVSKVKIAKSKIKLIKADRAEVKKFKETSKVSAGYKLDDLREEHRKRLATHPEEKEELKAQEDRLKARLDAERSDEIARRKAAIAEKKAQAKAEYRAIKKASRGPIRATRKALKASRKAAEAATAQYKKESIAFYKSEKERLEAEYPAKEISAALKACEREYSAVLKKSRRERKARIAEVERTHGISAAAVREQVKAVNVEFDKADQASYDSIVGEAKKRSDTREKLLGDNYFHNYCEKIRYNRKYAKARAIEVMKEVGIPQAEQRFRQYPFEFSGGMRQRIVIAIALTANPEILICDEPTTALDVTIQAQILELINQLKRERHMSVIFITHDMGVVAEMADRICVMYAGKIVEYGKVNEIFYDPRHPYTWALLSSIPDLDSKEKLEAIPGTPPNMNFPPKGDAFALRSKYALAIDFKEMPPLFKVSETHYAATWLLDPRAPRAEMPRIVSQRIKNNLRKAGVESYEQLSEKESD